MSTQDDPEWGRSRPHSTGAEVLVVVLSLAVMIWVMVEAVSYGQEIGRPVGVIGFVELFFRESLMLAVVMLGVLAIACASLWRLVRRVISKGRETADGRPSEG
jgi:hypothetical protein